MITPQWARGPIQLIEGCEQAENRYEVVKVEFDLVWSLQLGRSVQATAPLVAVG